MELDLHLLIKDSPIARNQGQTSSFKFDYQNEAGVISASKIRNASIGSAQIGSAAIGSANVGTLSFSQVTGGTATLGGAGNGDGMLVVNNSGGTEVVRLSNTGITITAGTITNVTQTTGTITSGTIINSLIDTSQITGGTITSPKMAGTPNFEIDTGQAGLNLDGDFSVQTYGGSVILVVKSGGLNYFFNCAGTF